MWLLLLLLLRRDNALAVRVMGAVEVEELEEDGDGAVGEAGVLVVDDASRVVG